MSTDAEVAKPSDEEFSPIAPKVRCAAVREIVIYRLMFDEDGDETDRVFVPHKLPPNFTREQLADHAGGGVYRIEFKGENHKWLGRRERLSIAGKPKDDEEEPDAYLSIKSPNGDQITIPKASEEMQNGVAAAIIKSILNPPPAPAAAAPTHSPIELQMIQAQLHRMQTDYDDSRRRFIEEINGYRESIRQLTQQNYDLIKRVAAAENKANAPQSWADEATKIAPLVGGLLEKIIPAKELAGPAANAAATVRLG